MIIFQGIVACPAPDAKKYMDTGKAVKKEKDYFTGKSATVLKTGSEGRPHDIWDLLSFVPCPECCLEVSGMSGPEMKFCISKQGGFRYTG